MRKKSDRNSGVIKHVFGIKRYKLGRVQEQKNF